jgi:hypothetical protein
MMINKTKVVLFAALMLGAASGALAASDGSHRGDDTELRSRAQAVGGPGAKHRVAPNAYGANAFRSVPAPSRQPEAAWPRMNCDLPIGC